jgi:hypothetical protein
MRTFLNIIAVVVLSTIVYNTLHQNIGWITGLSVWWVVGIYSAVSHIRWSRDANATREDNKVWIFYTWYALNGPILLIATKLTERFQTRYL